MAILSGIPGKLSQSGADVADLWMAGEIGRIVAYNELDALTTYVLWLRVAHFAGFFTADEYGQEQALVEELLQNEQEQLGRDHLKQFLDEWTRLRRFYR